MPHPSFKNVILMEVLGLWNKFPAISTIKSTKINKIKWFPRPIFESTTGQDFLYKNSKNRYFNAKNIHPTKLLELQNNFSLIHVIKGKEKTKLRNCNAHLVKLWLSKVDILYKSSKNEYFNDKNIVRTEHLEL